jgi:hypothetical protein
MSSSVEIYTAWSPFVFSLRPWIILLRSPTGKLRGKSTLSRMIEVQRYQAITLPAKAKARAESIDVDDSGYRFVLTTTSDPQVLTALELAGSSVEVRLCQTRKCEDEDKEDADETDVCAEL